MKRPAKCEPYVWVYRSVDTNPTAQLAWRCACGASSDRTDYPSREAALEDWTKHRDGATT